MNEQSEYAFAYASPIPQSWPNENGKYSKSGVKTLKLSLMEQQ